MFNPMTGQLPNSAGVKRLSIGVTDKDGKRAEMKFQAESTTAPLVAVDETPEPQPKRKTDWTRAQETKAVKDALQAAGINAVVSHGKGTAWGWLEINVGSAEQFTHTLMTYCECDQCDEARKRIRQIARRAVAIAQQVTGRHGEYDGNILCLTQKAWNQKLRQSVEILQPTEPTPADLAEMSAYFDNAETPLGEIYGGE